MEKAKQRDSKHEWGFISAYHAQYKEVEATFQKYWVLTTDKILTKALPDNPVFIYRKGPSFGDRIVKKKY